MGITITILVGLKSGGDPWEETIDVTDLESAEAEVKVVIKNFNNTLRSGEKPRKFYGIQGEMDIDTIDGFREVLMSAFKKFYHENQNNFGNAWVKEHFDRLCWLRLRLWRIDWMKEFKETISSCPYQEYQRLSNSALRHTRKCQSNKKGGG